MYWSTWVGDAMDRRYIKGLILWMCFFGIGLSADAVDVPDAAIQLGQKMERVMDEQQQTLAYHK